MPMPAASSSMQMPSFGIGKSEKGGRVYCIISYVFFLILGLVMTGKSDLKVPLLPLGPSCPLQTILLSDLEG
jgi:hypothetical protein